MNVRGSIGTLDGGMIELALDHHLNKTGDIWHIFIEVYLPLDCCKRLKPSLALSLVDITTLKMQHLCNYQNSIPNSINKHFSEFPSINLLY